MVRTRRVTACQSYFAVNSSKSIHSFGVPTPSHNTRAFQKLRAKHSLVVHIIALRDLQAKVIRQYHEYHERRRKAKEDEARAAGQASTSGPMADGTRGQRQEHESTLARRGVKSSPETTALRRRDANVLGATFPASSKAVGDKSTTALEAGELHEESDDEFGDQFWAAYDDRYVPGGSLHSETTQARVGPPSTRAQVRWPNSRDDRSRNEHKHRRHGEYRCHDPN